MHSSPRTGQAQAPDHDPTNTRAPLPAAAMACTYCGTTVNRRGVGDHVIPKSWRADLANAPAGEEYVELLVPCCSSCNSSKGARLPEDWLVSMLVDEALGRSQPERVAWILARWRNGTLTRLLTERYAPPVESDYVAFAVQDRSGKFLHEAQAAQLRYERVRDLALAVQPADGLACLRDVIEFCETRIQYPPKHDPALGRREDDDG